MKFSPAFLLLCFSAIAQDLPVSSGFDAKALDRSVSPCVDFYQFSCGTWLKNNPIPADQSSWGRFSELAERNKLILKEVLEKASASAANPIQKQLGDYYATCMDEKGIEAKGTQPLKPELDRIAAIKGLPDLVDELVRLHAIGVNAFFGFGSGQDFKDSTEVIAQADQGGLGLPERDYYFKTDAKSVETREKYVTHVRRMFELLGESPASANVR